MNENITNKNERSKFLTEVDGTINGERSESYGDPTTGFTKTANLFNGITGSSIQPVDVVIFNIVQKLERLSHTPGHRDSWLDIAGYAALGAEVSSATAIPAKKSSD
jgi:hypothetical protein